MLAIATDYAASTGDPEPYLQRIARAGFTRVHWCHHWNTDFLYSTHEVRQVKAWLGQYGLSLLDLHGSVGPEKDWASEKEYRRLAGVELVRNRLQMVCELGGDVVVMHSTLPRDPGAPDSGWSSLRRSLDELEPEARRLGVRIAIENGDWGVIRRILAAYPPDYIGLCYDSGHGNLVPDGLDQLEALKDRLLAIHLHDNDGSADQHKLPFTGTVDWERLTGILARSAYRRGVTLETLMHGQGIESEEEFLSQAFRAAGRLSAMVEAAG